MKRLSNQHEHILVNRILYIPVPVCLNGASTTIDAYVTSESAACNHLSESVYIGTIRKCGCHLRNMTDCTLSHIPDPPEDIDPRIQEETRQKSCWDQTH